MDAGSGGALFFDHISAKSVHNRSGRMPVGRLVKPPQVYTTNLQRAWFKQPENQRFRSSCPSYNSLAASLLATLQVAGPAILARGCPGSTDHNLF